MRTLALACALAAGAHGPLAAAQDREPADVPRQGRQWEAITMFHGMPSRNVRAIAQDREGLMWFGTDAGLVRYDGERVERLALAGGSPAVLALAVDQAGRLWIGSDRGAFVHAAGVTHAVAGTIGQRISAVAVAGDGTLRLAGEQGQLLRTTVRDAPWQAQPLAADEPLLRRADGSPLALLALAEHQGRLVAGTGGRGLLQVDAGRVREVRHPLRPFFVNALLSSGGSLFFGAHAGPAGRGLYALEHDRLRALDLLTGPVTALVQDAGGDLWVGTRERGVLHARDERLLERLTAASTAGGLASNRVHALALDRDGVVWIGTDRGVSRYDPGAPREAQLSQDPDGNFVHALFVAPDGRLRAGTQRGLFVRSPEGRWQVEPALASRAVHALAATLDGRLLAGCASGPLVQGRDGRWSSVPGADGVASVRAVQAHAGALYLATFGRGLERLEDARRELVWPTADADPALREAVSLVEVGDALWIGTARAGSFCFTRGSVTRNDALSALGVLRCAADDPRGGSWVGTSRGLARLSAGRLHSVLEGEDVRALVVDDRTQAPSVWCATQGSGLLKVALGTESTVLSSRLGADYGLPSENVFALVGTPEGLVAGTNRGVAEFQPGRRAPGLRLVRVLGQRPYAPHEWPALRLDYPQNSLLFHVAALGGRTFPGHFQYAFSLQDARGATVARSLSRDGQFSAGSLAPGRYRLAARGFGIDLVASDPVRMDFEVAGAPVPWPSIALAALLACALLALAWGARQNERLRRANAALSETRLQLVQETENERRRIARDLHDQTLADLRGLLMAPAAAGLRDRVEGISTEVRRICEDLSPSVLENVSLMAALEWALDEALKRCPPDRPCRGAFSCPDELAEELAPEPAVEIHVYRIVQEALANAARHARATQLRLTVALARDAALEISVEDDGRGFDVGASRAGRGLANIRSRASLIGARVSWQGRPEGGTRFLLRLKPKAALRP